MTDEKIYKTKTIGFRVTPAEYDLLLSKFGTPPNIRDFLLDLFDSRALKKSEKKETRLKK